MKKQNRHIIISIILLLTTYLIYIPWNIYVDEKVSVYTSLDLLPFILLSTYIILRRNNPHIICTNYLLYVIFSFIYFFEFSKIDFHSDNPKYNMNFGIVLTLELVLVSFYIFIAELGMLIKKIIKRKRIH